MAGETVGGRIASAQLSTSFMPYISHDEHELLLGWDDFRTEKSVDGGMRNNFVKTVRSSADSLAYPIRVTYVIE